MKAEYGNLLFILLLTCGAFCDNEDVLREKISTAVSLSSSHFLIPLDEEMFDYYITNGPKNYSFVIIIGSEIVECEICHVVQDSLSYIAKSWIYDNPTLDNLFFGFIDFSNSQNLIERLNVDTAPFIIHFPPEGGPKSGDKLDDLETLTSPEKLVQWINSRTSRQVTIHIPRDYTMLQGIGILLVFFLPTAIGFITIKTAVALLVSAFIISMLSGAMWISINSPPWTISEGSKRQYYISSEEMQLVSEALIIFSLYSCTSIGVVLLTQNGTKLNGFKRSFSIAVALAMAVFGFNQLSEYYSLKNGYLPYHVSLL